MKEKFKRIPIIADWDEEKIVGSVLINKKYINDLHHYELAPGYLFKEEGTEVLCFGLTVKSAIGRKNKPKHKCNCSPHPLNLDPCSDPKCCNKNKH